jgi:hypothetical protein
LPSQKAVLRLDTYEKISPRLIGCVFLGSFLFSILGCASISLEPQREDATRRLRRKPQVLIVKDFSFPRQAAVRADRSGQELVVFEEKLQISLREQLVRALGRYGIPVTVAKKPERPNVPANYKSNVMSGTIGGYLGSAGKTPDLLCLEESFPERLHT